MNLAQRKRLNLLTWLFCIAGLGVLGGGLFRALSFVPEGPTAIPVQAFPAAATLPEDVPWGVVEVSTPQDWRADYRLAGTFETYRLEGTNTVADSQLAIVDHVRHQTQRIVRKGDVFNEIHVLRILPDRVVLEKDQVEVELVLEKSVIRVASGGRVPAGDEEEAILRFEDMPALEITPYGKRVATNQWVIQRSLMMDYVEDLMRDPLRAAQMVRSMQADKVDGETAGFTLKAEGEQNFFDSMGLEDGDTVRKVNSMKMKSGRRANYLIQEFMKERMSAVVLDVERNGTEQKLIYIVR